MTSLAESLLAVAKKQRDLMQSFGEQSKTISVKVSSRDKSVSAEVNAAGTLTGLWLSPSASKLGADALAKLIVETAQAAARLVVERQGFLVKELIARMQELRQTPLTCWDGSTFVPDAQPGFALPVPEPPGDKNNVSRGSQRRL